MDLTTPQTTNATTPSTEPDTPREHCDSDLKGRNWFSMQGLDKVVVAAAAQEEGPFESSIVHGCYLHTVLHQRELSHGCFGPL